MIMVVYVKQKNRIPSNIIEIIYVYDYVKEIVSAKYSSIK